MPKTKNARGQGPSRMSSLSRALMAAVSALGASLGVILPDAALAGPDRDASDGRSIRLAGGADSLESTQKKFEPNSVEIESIQMKEKGLQLESQQIKEGVRYGYGADGQPKTEQDAQNPYTGAGDWKPLPGQEDYREADQARKDTGQAAQSTGQATGNSPEQNEQSGSQPAPGQATGKDAPLTESQQKKFDEEERRNQSRQDNEDKNKPLTESQQKKFDEEERRKQSRQGNEDKNKPLTESQQKKFDEEERRTQEKMKSNKDRPLPDAKQKKLETVKLPAASQSPKEPKALKEPKEPKSMQKDLGASRAEKTREMKAPAERKPPPEPKEPKMPKEKF